MDLTKISTYVFTGQAADYDAWSFHVENLLGMKGEDYASVIDDNNRDKHVAEDKDTYIY